MTTMYGNLWRGLEFMKPMSEREGMSGGRTNAIKLYDLEDPGTGKIIEYKDVTSLYLYINKTAIIQLGIRSFRRRVLLM